MKQTYIDDICECIVNSYKKLGCPKGEKDNRALLKLEPNLAVELYCNHHDYENVAKDDYVADAISDFIGKGIKTFTKVKSYQKISELSKFIKRDNNSNDMEIIQQIKSIYNERIEMAKKKFGLIELFYHCIMIDQPSKSLQICEYKMNKIDNDVKLDKKGENAIYFSDNNEKYKFSFSKSTLYMKFIAQGEKVKINIDSGISTTSWQILASAKARSCEFPVDWIDSLNKYIEQERPDNIITKKKELKINTIIFD